jgi:hypothetical protein
MIFELREYTLQVGKVAEFLELHEREGLAFQREILGAPAGYYATDVGTLNQVVSLWVYESPADRAERRGRLASDPGWQAYLEKAMPIVVRAENRIMRPAPFFERELRGS